MEVYYALPKTSKLQAYLLAGGEPKNYTSVVWGLRVSFPPLTWGI